MVVALEVANDALLKEGILGDTAAVGSWRREAPMVAAVMMTGFDLDCPSWLFYGNITASRSSKVKVKVKKVARVFIRFRQRTTSALERLTFPTFNANVTQRGWLVMRGHNF